MSLAIIVVLFDTIIGAFGSLYLKKGASKLSRNFRKVLGNYELFFGIFLYVLSMIIYIGALQYENLSVLFPVVSLTYVWVSLLSVKFLNENMNKYKWMGILIIILGVILVTS